MNQGRNGPRKQKQRFPLNKKKIATKVAQPVSLKHKLKAKTHFKEDVIRYY